MASDQFHTLLAMQEHDTVLDQLHHRGETLPERATRQELLEQGQSLANERDELVVQRDEIASREAKLEAELNTSEARITQIDKRMYSGEVSAARDLQAMAEEIDRLKAYCSRLEDDAIQALDEREPLDTRIGELESGLSDLAARIHELDRVIADTESEIDAEV